MRLSEFSLIEEISKRLTFKGKDVVVGIGDDTAVVKCRNKYQLLTSDSLTEGSHFVDNWKKIVENLYYYLGKKLVNINASDIASMGGEPKFGLIDLALSEKSDEREVLEFYEGINEEGNRLKVAVVGGNITKSKSTLFDMFLVGESSSFMLRSEAKPGDLVAVSGEVGDSRGGLELLLKGKKEPWKLVEKFLSPKAKIKEGRELLKLGIKCCTDVSDGLLFNLGTIAKNSSVKVEVFSDKIPISKELKETFKERALEFGLQGGEDYELIITFPDKLIRKVEELGFKVIGEVKEGKGVFVDGKEVKPKGFQHFKEEA
ncbi:thiamine-phosphate kinase [Thermovibrio sp.]